MWNLESFIISYSYIFRCLNTVWYYHNEFLKKTKNYGITLVLWLMRAVNCINLVWCIFQLWAFGFGHILFMNSSDSEEDSYNERSALVQSESPTLPSYNQDHDMSLPEETDTKRVSVGFYYSGHASTKN